MAAVALGAVKQGVEIVKGAIEGALDQVTLPEGEWIDAGCVCDAPCMIAGICPCSCIVVYTTWGKIMKEEAGKAAGFVFLGNCVGCLLGSLLYYIGTMFEFALLGSCTIPLMMIGQMIALAQNRKKLGQWMNIPEDKLATPQDWICECFCCCLMMSAEQRSVEEWASKTMLVEEPLKAAHEAKKQMDAAANAVTGAMQP